VWFEHHSISSLGYSAENMACVLRMKFPEFSLQETKFGGELVHWIVIDLNLPKELIMDRKSSRSAHKFMNLKRECLLYLMLLRLRIMAL